MLIISFGDKFTSGNFDAIYSNYWHPSFKAPSVIFDLSELEWIAIEQATFLLAWINELKERGISTTIKLPDFSQGLSPKIRQRRETALSHLVNHWHIRSNTGNTTILTDLKANRTTTTGNPFVKLPYIEYNSTTFDQDFEEIFDTQLAEFSQTANQLITHLTSLNYFDNHFLHYSILKEFFSNICQHAYVDQSRGNAYISLKVNKRISKEAPQSVINQMLRERYEERPAEEKSFFYNGRVPINDDLIELTFLDFGKGIVQTLKKKYEQEDKDKLSPLLGTDHFAQAADTRTLEYSFLLFTSKYELGKHFEVHDYVPRGLFIIKEIVRRYKGMIIARSGNGKVVFDFSKGDAIFYPAKNDTLTHFNGTVITILLPTKKADPKTLATVTSDMVADEQPIIKSVNLLNLFTRSTPYSRDETPYKKQAVFENFFTTLSKELAGHNKEKRLTLLDFAGIEISSNDLINKVIYFLSYCPLISENNQLCLYNLIDKGINESIIFSSDKKLKSKGFYQKPIPAVYANMDISWIGVTDDVLSAKLTEAWKERLSAYATEDDLATLAGNVISIEYLDEKQSEIKVLLPSFWELMEVVLLKIAKTITAEVTNTGIEFPFLKSEKHNYNNIKQVKTDNENNPRAFQTPNGKFQKKFFSFIEKLYVHEYRRGIATYLCTALHISKPLIKDLSKLKILTVTMSSQLLGQEFTEIFNQLYAGKITTEYIPLSNYHDFASEEQFEEIGANEKIIVINDVISTGRLSQSLYYTLKAKRSDLEVLVTILDTRLKQERDNQANIPTISLLQVNVGKFNENPFPKTIPIRINPILNTPITMSKENTGWENVLLEPIAFARLFKDDSFFLVGNFKNNTVYHSYYFITKELFIDDKEKQFPFTREIFRNLFEQLKKRTISPLVIDLVFYPFFSSVAVLAPHLKKIITHFSEHSAVDCFPIPRIMTPKGWRFSFPPKHLNLRTKGGQKSALIIDDGSCTGDTLIQLVDTIGFLELKEIFILVIFARLEDFQSEFFTKIKSIEVGGRKINIHIFFGTQFHIPVYNKSSTATALELEDAKKFTDFFVHRNIEIPGFVVDYLDERKHALMKSLSPEISHQPSAFLRFDKKIMFLYRDFIGKYDSYRLYKEDESNTNNNQFITENFLVADTRHIKELLAVIVHEPYLFRLLKRTNLQILHNLQNFILNKLSSNNELNEDYISLSFLLRAFTIVCEDHLQIRETVKSIFELIESRIKNATTEFEKNNFKKLYGLISYKLLSYIIEGPDSPKSDFYFATRNLLRNLHQEINLPYASLQAGTMLHVAQPTYLKVIRLLYDKTIPELDQYRAGDKLVHFVKTLQYYARLTVEGINHKETTHYNNFEKLSEKLVSFIKVGSDQAARQQFVDDFKNAYDDLWENMLTNLLHVLEQTHAHGKSNEKKSIAKWLQTIRYLKEKIKGNLNDEFISKIPDRKLLQNLKKWFEQFNEEILSPYSPAANFILSANSDPVQVWSEATEEYKAINPKVADIKLINSTGADIPILKVHPYILKQIFLHILNNKKSYALTSSCAYSIFVEDRMNVRSVVLNFKQNKSFVKDINGNRGLSEIRYMLSIYGGHYQVIDHEQFTFEIIFPLNVINNETGFTHHL